MWKNEKFSLAEKKFRQNNYLVISLVKPLLWRNFCQKYVRENFRNFHTVLCVFQKNEYFSVKSTCFLSSRFHRNFCVWLRCVHCGKKGILLPQFFRKFSVKSKELWQWISRFCTRTFHAVSHQIFFSWNYIHSSLVDFFRETNFWITSLSKALISQNFLSKM